MTHDSAESVLWYVMHDHSDGERHSHSVLQHHAEDVNNPRANDHSGVETQTWEEFQMSLAEDAANLDGAKSTKLA
jgi:hypothetical protein